MDTGPGWESASARTPGASGGAPKPQTARALALGVIRRVTEEGAYSNLALAAALRSSRLAPRDGRLVAELAYGTLRRLLTLDRAIARASTRTLGDVDPVTLAVLRLGSYQLLHTRIPPHAAVSETVALALPSGRGFANAVLRSIASHPPAGPEGGDDRAVSARTGLAAWAVGELRRVLPEEEVEPAAAALASRADLCLRANPCRTSAPSLTEALERAGVAARPGLHHGDVLRVGSGVPSELPGFAEGWFAVQDEASALVGAAVQAAPGERVLDSCAGPGGKASDLACAVGPEGLLVAADATSPRAMLVARTAARLGVPVRVVVQDARHPALRPEFDAVLVDAPCSGVGAARRRPELLWRPRREDLARLARLQVAILAGASELVRPGGRLVYSVCTYPRAETEAAVRAFLARRPEFEPAPVPGPDGPAPAHRLWPHRHGTDAMFYAGFRRRRSPRAGLREGRQARG